MGIRHGLTLAPICLLLAGCASAPLQKDGSVAWDGLGLNDNPATNSKLHPNAVLSSHGDPDAKREAKLATLEPRSAEWQALHDKIESDREKRLKAQLRICNGCLPVLNGTADKVGPTRSASATASSIDR